MHLFQGGLTNICTGGKLDFNEGSPLLHCEGG
jgi:hypothetical protein